MKSRIVSIDIFRGLTMIFMIIVNTPGSWKHVYPPLRHASWHGCTPTDLIFPAFLFIVGVAMFYSLRKYGNSLNQSSLFRIFRRVAAIFIIGILLKMFPHFGRDLGSLRIMGVLQRIALAYGIAAILALSIKREQLWILIGATLLFYWGVLFVFGGSNPYSIESNLVRTIDIAILGKQHLYTGFGIAFDPEGLLSTLPAVITIITGYYAGSITGKGSKGGPAILKLILIGAASIGLGLAWDLLLPINKPLWTSSYVLYTSGISMVIYALLYLISDVLKFRGWEGPLNHFGVNALVAYILSVLWTKTLMIIPAGSTGSLYTWLYSGICVPLAGDLNGSLLFAIMQVVIIWVPVYLLFRKKIYIRL